MIQNENLSTEDRAKALGSLEAVEKVVNEYAFTFAKEYRIKRHQYHIHLVKNMMHGGVLGITRGPVAQIYVLWPEMQPHMKSLLRNAFKQIRERELVDCVSIEPYMHIRKRDAEYRRFIKEKIGDEAEILPDLLPKRRLRYKIRRILEIEITDKETGITETIRTHDESRDTWSVKHELRHRVSRIVRAVENATELNKDGECDTGSTEDMPGAGAGSGNDTVRDTGKDNGTSQTLPAPYRLMPAARNLCTNIIIHDALAPQLILSRLRAR